jgi:2'-5' RNA ligase
VTGTDGRSALVVVAAEAEPVVREWRLRFDRESVDRGIPTHLTILFPFVPEAANDRDTLALLRRLYAPVRTFAYRLASVESFPDAAWLAPEPRRPFLDLIARTRQAFPDRPPYGNPEHLPVPHCTLGIADDPARVDEMVRELRDGLGPSLPIHCRAVEVALVGELPNGAWVVRETFPFGDRT